MNTINADGYEVHLLTWQGIEIEVLWQTKFLNLSHTAHLQVQSKTRQPIPITETGYRSHFCQAKEVALAG